jgi:outer membrane receptor protein involved in Fe transport
MHDMARHDLFNGACRLAIALGALSALAGAAHAADATSSSSSTTVSSVTVEGEAITTAPRVVPLTAAYSQSTITNEDIRNLAPSASLQTLLENQPSIFAIANAPNGVGNNIFFRAFNSGQFAETYEGVAINDIFNGGVTGEADTINNVLFIPENVDSVVLTRGVNNPAVNSYNSLGGTINFVPRQPTADPGGTLSASYGSFDSYTVAGTINTGDYHGIKQLFSLDYRESNGWIPNTANRNTNAFYSAAYDAPNGDHISLVAVYDYNSGRTPFETPVPLLQQNGGYYQYPLDVANEKDKDSQYLVILDGRIPVSSHVTWDNKIFVGGDNYLRTSYANPAFSSDPYELPSQAATYDYWIYFPFGPTYNPKKTFGSNPLGNAYHFYGYTTFGIGYTPTLTVTLPYNTVTLGGNVTYGHLNSREFWYGTDNVPQVVGYNDAWDEHDSRVLASVFAQDEIKLLNDSLTITPGVKYIYAHTQDTDDIGFFYPYGGTVSDDEDYVAPTVGINYKPTSYLSFNFAFGENIKFPDISAYYDDIPGTTSSTPLVPKPVKIKPEHVNDYELGARFQKGGFSASVDVYREDFSNIFIDTFNAATFTTQVTNGGDARYQGVEVQLAQEVSLDRWGALRGFFNYAYNEAKFTSSFTADSVGNNLSVADFQVNAGEPLADVPQSLLSFGATWMYDNFRLDLAGRYIGSEFILDTDTGLPSSTKIPSYFIMDIGLSKTIPLQDAHVLAKSVKLSITVDNLFDQYYYTQAYTSAEKNIVGLTEFATPGAPRAVYGKIEIAF